MTHYIYIHTHVCTFVRENLERLSLSLTWSSFNIMMIQFTTDDILISATSVETVFSDGTILGDQDYFNVSLLPGTALGDELWIEGRHRRSQEQEVQEPNEELYTIRLIVITPEKDWRTSASYAWKLDSAWMSSPPSASSSRPSDRRSWLHWNVESYIDSVIQVDDSNQIWECDELDLHFRPIREARTSSAQHSNQLVTPPMERMTLKGFRLGLGFNRSVVDTGTDHYSPCASQPCVVVDGSVQGGTGRDKGDAASTGPSSTRSTEWEVGAQEVALLAVLLAALFILGMVCYRRYHQTKLYDRLTPLADENVTSKSGRFQPKYDTQ